MKLTSPAATRKLGPGVRVAIWAFRGGVWQRTEPVDAAEVEWERLLREDRVEVE